MCNLCESYIFVQVVMINEAEHKMFIIKYYTTRFFINYDSLNLDSNFMIYMIGNCILITNFTGFFFLSTSFTNVLYIKYALKSTLIF